MKLVHSILISLSAACLTACNTTSSGLSSFTSPADRSTYTADFKTYAPEGGVRPDKSTTALEGIVLLNIQSAYEGEVTEEQLSNLTKDVQATIALLVSKSRPSRMAINVRLYPDKNPTFNIAVTGTKDKPEILALHNTLMKKYRLRTKSRVLGYEFYVTARH